MQLEVLQGTVEDHIQETLQNFTIFSMTTINLMVDIDIFAVFDVDHFSKEGLHLFLTLAPKIARILIRTAFVHLFILNERLKQSIEVI